MTLCRIETCPLEARDGSPYCGIHQFARLAKQLGISGDKEGKGAKSCKDCKRKFKDEDFVHSEAQTTRKSNKKGAAISFSYRHIQCAPTVKRLSRKALKESVKPLLSELEA